MQNATTNFRNLASNPYPGRGIIVGLDDTEEHLVQVYWIMGRSENSRNRVFGKDRADGRLFTEPADPAKVVDPKLTIYNAMRESEKRVFVVSNGHQTDAVLEGVSRNESRNLRTLLDGWSYEPDAPNYTPRITGISYFFSGVDGCKLAIIRRKPSGDSEFFQYSFWGNELEPGTGYGIHTYSGDGNPLPSFEGEPVTLPLRGNMNDILGTYWRALNEENRVSLAVKFIRVGDGVSSIVIKNRLEKV